MKNDEVIELAEKTALFFRRLLDDGVPLETAATLTATFLSASILAARGDVEVKRPWDTD